MSVNMGLVRSSSSIRHCVNIFLYHLMNCILVTTLCALSGAICGYDALMDIITSRETI